MTYLTNEDEGVFCLINNFVSKERTLGQWCVCVCSCVLSIWSLCLALSDGVFSIIATLIVLDLT